MIYDLKTPIGIHQFEARCNYLKGKQAKVELLHKKSKRTINQNSYVHLIMDYWATQVGYTSEEAKQYFKNINPQIFQYEKKGDIFIKGTRHLDVEEMRIFIDNIIKFSEEECGIALPRPHDLAFIDEINNEVERHSEGLKGHF